MNKSRTTAVLAMTWIALSLAHPALAQPKTNPLGTVEATLDGTRYSGETLSVPSEGTATSEFAAFGPVTSVTIQAHDPQADSIMQNVLSIEFSLMGEDASASMMDASVSWWPEGMSQPFFHSEGSEAELTVALEALSLEDGAASAKGRFSARICRKDGFVAEADLSDCMPVEGVFETALHKSE
ncbi:hypothetical protein [Maritimibacter sp. HL-12]|uniref:hypothetical protein n=1 Tax=Maritimibacter sp. HL-12 TaxID=1162418 RepID=UPI000A0EFDAE|nr:hypothetical protein [Maritimibacter sp. HL-12]SMH38015.1 hypothetical protein SAMN05661107_0855 [Maritimibacter sp. HL-12]